MTKTVSYSDTTEQQAYRMGLINNDETDLDSDAESDDSATRAFKKKAREANKRLSNQRRKQNAEELDDEDSAMIVCWGLTKMQLLIVIFLCMVIVAGLIYIAVIKFGEGSGQNNNTNAGEKQTVMALRGGREKQTVMPGLGGFGVLGWK
jgi:hypothetical protein